MTLGVHSEVGQLRQVILHRPGNELSRLTPDNVEELLFDDVMWAKKAREEHDAFAQELRDKGVQVLYYGELLAETLEMSKGRSFVLDRLCTPEMVGPALVDPLRRLSRSVRSPRCTSAPIAFNCSTPASLRVSPRTWCPAAISSFTSSDPMNPVAPVTNTRIVTPPVVRSAAHRRPRQI